MAVGAVEIFPHKFRSVRLESIPDNQQRLLQMHLERLEELDDLLLFDAPFVKAEQIVRSGQPGRSGPGNSDSWISGGLASQSRSQDRIQEQEHDEEHKT